MNTPGLAGRMAKKPQFFRTLKNVVRPVAARLSRGFSGVGDLAGITVLAARAAIGAARPGSVVSQFMSGLAIGRSPASDRTVVMIAITDLRIDPRVEREARALARRGYRVSVIAPLPRDWDGTGLDWGDSVTFDHAPERTGRFAYGRLALFDDALYEHVLRHHPFAFHAHDLNTAFVGIAAAKKTGAHLVCDFHEWFSENVTYFPIERAYRRHSRLKKAIYRWLEGRALEEASAVVTVCDSLADGMAVNSSRGRRAQVVRNIPDLKVRASRTYPPLREQVLAKPGQFIILYQGGTGETRLLEPVIAALALAPRAVLVIRGPFLERYGPGYAALARNRGVRERLVLREPVPSTDVVAAARGADAGIWTLPNLCKNFYFALPNKLFEYVAAGLPVLSADYPEAKRFVEEHELGLTFDAYDPKSIAAAINRLAGDSSLQTRFRTNTARALTKIDAEREWAKVADLYDALDPPRRTA